VKTLIYIESYQEGKNRFLETPIKAILGDVSIAVSHGGYNFPLILDNNLIDQDTILEKIQELIGNKITLRTDYIFKCTKCNMYFNSNELSKLFIKTSIILRIVKIQNILIILPFESTVRIPDRWVKWDLPNISIYMDQASFDKIKDFLKKGVTVNPKSIEIVTGKQIREILFFSDFSEEVINYQSPQFKCPYCAGEVNKVIANKVYYDNVEIGKMKDTLLLLNDYGKIILSKEITKAEKIYIFSKNINLKKLDKIGAEIIKIRPPDPELIRLSTRVYRSFSFLNRPKKYSSDEIFYIESKSFFSETQSEVIEYILKGDISKALRTLINNYRIFNRIFLNGSKRTGNFHLSAANDFRDLFYGLFVDGSKLKLPNYSINYDFDLRVFLSLFKEVERAKSQTHGRGVRYKNLIIGTDFKLPQTSKLKSLLNVDELIVIKGVWHGLKFKVQPNPEKLGKYYKSYYSSIKIILSKKDGQDVLKKINSGGYSIGIDGQEIKITREMIDVIPTLPEGYTKRNFMGGEFYLNTVVDECSREIQKIVRKVNFTRKKMGLKYNEYIDIWADFSKCDETSFNYIDFIKETTKALKVTNDKEFKIRKVHINELRSAIKKLIGTETREELDRLILEGVHDVTQLINGEAKSNINQDNIIENLKKYVKNIKYSSCPLCNSNMEGEICTKCGLNMDSIKSYL